jgi:MSHA biogenesis protein MshM
MQPLSRNILENYLMFRMRAAGYHGPNIFSPGAIKLLASSSNGLMRRVNILADKSLLAAFVDDTYYIKPQHVQAAMRDSELDPAGARPFKKLLWGGAVALLLLGLAAWWIFDKPQFLLDQAQLSAQHKPQTPATVAAAPLPAFAPVATQANPDDNAASAVTTTQTTVPTTAALALVKLVSKPAHNRVRKTILFDQRLEAGKQLLDQKKTVASIQLYYNETVNPERIEGFLRRADKLGVLAKIYLLPAKLGGKDGMRVVYGDYPSVEAAHNAVKDMPARYKKAFATSTYIF